MLKPDRWIRAQAGMIEPLVCEKVREVEGRRIVSFGLSSYGYDIRLAPDGILTYTSSTTVDPKRLRAGDTRPVYVRTNSLGESFIELAPGELVLGYSVERFVIPADVFCVILGKSTIARTGVSLLATPLEPGWEGYVTLELTNASLNWVRVYVGEGIGQVLFYEAEPCDAPYGDGTYQGQGARVVLPFGASS